MGKHTVIRYHDFCAGHTVTGHESKCAHLHGHNYRAHFHVQMNSHCSNEIGAHVGTKDLDKIGRVIDFNVVKDRMCEWLEREWDHKFLINKDDPRLAALQATDPSSLVVCDFNPTAENMAKHLVEVIGPIAFLGTEVELIGVELAETRKCSVTYFK